MKASSICGATKANGQPCLQRPGHGTDHKGKGRCKRHEAVTAGGVVTTAQHLSLNSRNDELRQEIDTMGQPLPTTPADAIQGVLNLAAGQLFYVNGQVLGLEAESYFPEADSDREHRWVKWQGILMERVARYASIAAGMGVAERSLQIHEQQTQLLAGVLRGVVDELDLTPEQRQKVGPAIRKHLLAIRTEQTA